MARLGQFRRDTLENWILENPILADGEFILVATKNATPLKYDIYKVGNGISTFTELEELYYSPCEAKTETLDESSNGVDIIYNCQEKPISKDLITLTINGVITRKFTLNEKEITLITPPSALSLIEINYFTKVGVESFENIEELNQFYNVFMNSFNVVCKEGKGVIKNGVFVVKN